MAGAGGPDNKVLPPSHSFTPDYQGSLEDRAKARAGARPGTCTQASLTTLLQPSAAGRGGNNSAKQFSAHSSEGETDSTLPKGWAPATTHTDTGLWGKVQPGDLGLPVKFANKFPELESGLGLSAEDP